MVLKYTPDYRRDWIDWIPLIRFGVFGGLGIFMLLFGWLWGAVMWVLHIVLYLFLNAMINSFCHIDTLLKSKMKINENHGDGVREPSQTDSDAIRLGGSIAIAGGHVSQTAGLPVPRECCIGPRSY
jgi:hypothetical protein